MAWVEQVGRHSWRVRYRTASGYGSVPGFDSHGTALAYLQDVPSIAARTLHTPARAQLGPRRPSTTTLTRNRIGSTTDDVFKASDYTISPFELGSSWERGRRGSRRPAG